MLPLPSLVSRAKSQDGTNHRLPKLMRDYGLGLDRAVLATASAYGGVAAVAAGPEEVDTTDAHHASRIAGGPDATKTDIRTADVTTVDVVIEMTATISVRAGTIVTSDAPEAHQGKRTPAAVNLVMTPAVLLHMNAVGIVGVPALAPSPALVVFAWVATALLRPAVAIAAVREAPMVLIGTCQVEVASERTAVKGAIVHANTIGGMAIEVEEADSRTRTGICLAASPLTMIATATATETGTGTETEIGTVSGIVTKTVTEIGRGGDGIGVAQGVGRGGGAGVVVEGGEQHRP